MNQSGTAVQSFSEREQEVFSSLLEGHTNQGIAVSLGICVKTVEVHLSSIYRKIGVKSRNQAILWWVLQVNGVPSLTGEGIRRK